MALRRYGNPQPKKRQAQTLAPQPARDMPRVERPIARMDPSARVSMLSGGRNKPGRGEYSGPGGGQGQGFDALMAQYTSANARGQGDAFLRQHQRFSDRIGVGGGIGQGWGAGPPQRPGGNPFGSPPPGGGERTGGPRPGYQDGGWRPGGGGGQRGFQPPPGGGERVVGPGNPNQPPPVYVPPPQPPQPPPVYVPPPLPPQNGGGTPPPTINDFANVNDFANGAVSFFGSPEAAAAYFAANGMRAETGWLEAGLTIMGVPLNYTDPSGTTWNNTSENQTFGSGDPTSYVNYNGAPTQPPPTQQYGAMAPQPPVQGRGELPPGDLRGQLPGMMNGPRAPMTANPTVPPAQNQARPGTMPTSGPGGAPSAPSFVAQARQSADQALASVGIAPRIVGPTAKPDPEDDALGLPLSPEFEAARRALEDNLAAELAAIGVARAEIPALVELVTQRLATDQAEVERRTNEAANARGVYNSTIRTDDLGDVRAGFDRNRQDFAFDVARMFGELSQRESGARGDYNRSLSELLLALAQDQATDDRTVVPREADADDPIEDEPATGKTRATKPRVPKERTKAKKKRARRGGK